MDQNEAKLLAARAALDELPPEGVIGLGSGSTAKLFVDEVGARVRAGAAYRAVATSKGTRQQAEGLGIPVLADEDGWGEIAVTVDGADEVDEDLNLIKGGGGALTREKIVNDASKRNVIIVDETKIKKRLGESWAIPVEVLRFGFGHTRDALAKLGKVRVRAREGATFVTDAGNFIIDVHTGPIADPAALDRAMHDIPGVVETGLFLRRASLVIVAGSSGVTRLTPKKR
jgi:ribose 5-phosphate isomerase A